MYFNILGEQHTNPKIIIKILLLKYFYSHTLQIPIINQSQIVLFASPTPSNIFVDRDTILHPHSISSKCRANACSDDDTCLRTFA